MGLGEQMQHEGDRVSHDTDDQRIGEHQVSSERSLRSATAVPSTMLVADMDDGSSFLQSWWDGPSGGQSEAPWSERMIIAG
jgi:hypothetical protein